MRNGQPEHRCNAMKCENRQEAAIFKIIIPQEKSRFEAKVTQDSEHKTRARDKLRLYNESITLRKEP